jgi:heme oxygenase (biliverdin-IX-beta and delta-forming)
METATIPFIQRLRNATALQHARLEALPLSKALLKEEVTRHDYARYLLCMKGVMEFYDHTILDQIDEIIPQSRLRKKLPAIKEDLKYLREQGSLDDDVTVLKPRLLRVRLLL